MGRVQKPMHCVPELSYELLRIRPVFRISSPAGPKPQAMTARSSACLAKIRIIKRGLLFNK
jgi:hypothetical protein